MADKGVGSNLREWGPLFACAALALVAFSALVLHSDRLSGAVMLALALVCPLAWAFFLLANGGGPGWGLPRLSLRHWATATRRRRWTPPWRRPWVWRPQSQT